MQLYTDLIARLCAKQHYSFVMHISDAYYMHCMDATDLNIAQLTVTLTNSLVIMENVNL